MGGECSKQEGWKLLVLHSSLWPLYTITINQSRSEWYSFPSIWKCTSIQIFFSIMAWGWWGSRIPWMGLWFIKFVGPCYSIDSSLLTYDSVIFQTADILILIFRKFTNQLMEIWNTVYDVAFSYSSGMLALSKCNYSESYTEQSTQSTILTLTAIIGNGYPN